MTDGVRQCNCRGVRKKMPTVWAIRWMLDRPFLATFKEEGVSIMKKIQSMDEGTFLRWFFGAFSVAALIAAVCMPDRGQMLSGLGQIVSQPSKISTNYFAVGGYAATFLNMALVGFAALGLFVVFRGTPNNVSNLAFLLTLGFTSWGINIVNIWPTVFGVMLYGLVKKEKQGSLVNAMLFSTGIAPLITDLMIRYPNAEVVGFNLAGIAVSLIVGFCIGFFLPAGLANSPKVHKGFDLYSAALPIGMTAFFLNAVLYKTFGVALPAAPDAATLQVASQSVTNVFCLIVFGTCVALALAMGCKPGAYWAVIRRLDSDVNLSGSQGNAMFLMNVGVFGLFILAWYNLIGASFNGVTFGIIFCMLATCDSGSNPVTVWPIMAGYFLASLVSGWLSGLAGGSFAGAINAQAICVGLCYANGLSPICRKYGFGLGILAGTMHYLLVTSVPNLHGGYCLYNGGFTAALICILLVPILERFARTREERLAVKK